MTNSKHDLVRDAILADLRAGVFADGRLPTEIELCRRFQVSRPTVAHALADLVNQNLIERRRRAGTRIRPATERERIGLLLPGLGRTEILDPVIGALTSTIQKQGREVVLGGTDPRAHDATQLLTPILERRPDGVIFAPIEQTEDRVRTNTAVLAGLAAAGIPVVLFDREAGLFASASTCDLVAIDHWQAAFTLGAHLAERGCRRIAYVPLLPMPSSAELRLSGLREAMVRVGGTVTTVPFIQAAETAAAVGLYEAVVCVNDLTAAQLLPALEANHRRIPADLRIAGFDDVAFAALLRVPLTTVRQPYDQLAEAAVSVLLERIAQPQRPVRRVLLPALLVQRASTE